MKGTPWRAFLFDFDGTLAELNIDFDAMRADIVTLLREYNLESVADDHLPVLETIARAASRLVHRKPKHREHFMKAAQQRIEAIERDAAQHSSLFPDTRPLLEALKNRGILMAVVTRNSGAAVRQVFPDIDNYCILLAREDTDQVKPNPGHLNLALKRLRVPTAMAAMVGDHPIDMRSGRLIGVDTIGVLTGHSPREALWNAGADWILSRASQILHFPL